MKPIYSIIILAAACGSAIAADGWTDLFNGKDLDGWVQRGGKAEVRGRGRQHRRDLHAQHREHLPLHAARLRGFHSGI